jgi:hypothetical protein
MKNYLKKLILTFGIVIVALSTSATNASAHVLKSDGSIGAVIHIEPDDDPIIGEDATFFFEFKDKDNKFGLSRCDCSFSIFDGNERVFSESFAKASGSGDLSSPEFTYIFPKKGVYTLTVIGKPLSDQDFKNFTLEYDLRVDRETGDQNSRNNFPLALVILTFLAIILILVFFFKRKGPDKTADQPKTPLGKMLLLIFFWILFSPIFSNFLEKHNHESNNTHLSSKHSQHPCCLPKLTVTTSPQVENSWDLPKELVNTDLTNSVPFVSVQLTFNKSPPQTG